MGREPMIRAGSPADDADGEDQSSPGLGREFDLNDTRYDDELRPQRLADVVGQRKVLERLRIILDATQKRREPLGHLLLDGPPGLGKTTLATIVPKELGTEMQITSGPSLKAPKDLLPYLTNAVYASVLFIDEIHRMPPAVEEFIYPAMEDFRIDITLGDGLNARIVNMKLQPFTVIGATTRTGMLTAALRDRFVNREHLEFYETAELAEIVQRSAAKLRTHTTADATSEIALRSRGTPRKANNLLRWARDFAQSKSDGRITKPIALEAFRLQEIDELGLDGQDRRYLRTLITVFTGGPAGVQALGHTLDIPADTLSDEVEPFLLRCGLIQRTPRGRMVTAAAFTHLGLQPPEPVAPGDSEPADAEQGRLF